MGRTVVRVRHGNAALAEELRRAVSRFVRMVRSEAGTPRTAQSETLALLERQGPMNVAALARLRRVKHQTMRLVVGQLESDGLVTGAVDPDDRRSRMFRMTAAGRDQLLRERRLRESLIERLLQAELCDEEQAVLSRAITMLDRISGAIAVRSLSDDEKRAGAALHESTAERRRRS